MTDLQKLKSLLDNQQEKGIKSGKWDRVDDYYQGDDSRDLTINSVEISFKFTSKGRFIGICNWKN